MAAIQYETRLAGHNVYRSVVTSLITRSLMSSHMATFKDDTRFGDKHKPLPYRRSTFIGQGLGGVRRYGRYDIVTAGGKNHRVHNIATDTRVNTLFATAPQAPKSKWCLYRPTSQTQLLWASQPWQIVDNRLLNKVNEISTDIGMIIGELKETVGYVAGYAADLVGLLLAVKRGKLNRVARKLGIKRKHFYTARGTLKTVSQRHLEVTFALNPLIKDISDLIELFTDPNGRLFVTSVTSGNNLTVSDSWKHSYPYNYSYDEEAAVKLRAGLTFRVSNAEAVAKRALGLRVDTSLAYELLPFSWVVDYAVGVGDFLDLLSSTEGLSFMYGYKSMKYDGSLMEFRESKPTTGDTGVYESWDRAKYICTAFERKVTLAFPKPHILSKLDSLTSGKITNLAALLAVLTLK